MNNINDTKQQKKVSLKFKIHINLFESGYNLQFQNFFKFAIFCTFETQHYFHTLSYCLHVIPRIYWDLYIAVTHHVYVQIEHWDGLVAGTLLLVRETAIGSGEFGRVAASLFPNPSTLVHAKDGFIEIFDFLSCFDQGLLWVVGTI
jgi:hypothetical protein